MKHVPDLSFFLKLCKCKTNNERCKIISKATCKELNIFYEVIKNLLVGNISLSVQEFKKLKRYNNVFKYLATRNNCNKRKIRILKKSKAIPNVLKVLKPIINDHMNKLVEK
jgi:hypothetical protein